MITLLTCLLLSRHHFVIDLIKVEFVFGERKVVHMCMCVRVFVRVRVCVRERERERLHGREQRCYRSNKHISVTERD